MKPEYNSVNIIIQVYMADINVTDTGELLTVWHTVLFF